MLALLRRRRLLLISALFFLIPVALLYFFLGSSSSSNTFVAPHMPPGLAPVLPENTTTTRAPVPFLPLDANRHVHIFYYAWYGNINMDGQYVHWKHKRIAHWSPERAKKFSTSEHFPPDDIGANFYPKLGPYSSHDSTVYHEHFEQIRKTGIGVVVLSWYPPHLSDNAGLPREFNTLRILTYAAAHDLKVALHIEPYAGRQVTNLRQYLEHTRTYTNHSAYYHIDGRPVYYIYDSYLIRTASWTRLLKKDGDLTVRGTAVDGYFIGLFLRNGDCNKLADSGFDAGYSYFAVDGFSDGSRCSNWPSIVADCRRRGLEFVPSIGPGYDDSAVRPWNEENTRKRDDGRYYRLMFDKFLASGARYLSITSFNEWHEGTQIEPAVPKKSRFRTYKDYLPNPPDFYLHLTNHMVARLSKKT